MILEHPEMNQALVEDDEIEEDDWDEEFCILEEETGNGIPVSGFVSFFVVLFSV